MIWRFFNLQTKSITSATFLIFLSTLGSGFLGIIRDRLLAWRFGAGQDLDIYFAAFRIPDLVYGILIAGGILATFLPIFTEYFQKDEKKGWELTNNFLNCLLILLVLICSLLFVFTPQLIKFIAPGFSSRNKTLTISLTRLMLLSPVFLGLSSIFSLILQYFNQFLIYSLTPIFYNLGIIFGIIFFVPPFGIFGLAFGVILGALFHLLVQIPAAFISGYRYSMTLNFKEPGLKEAFKLTIPRIIGVASYHLNLIVITAIASTLKSGSISIFNFANNVQHLPIRLIGVSFAVAVFPTLSRIWSEGKKEEFIKIFSLVFRQILCLIIPVSILMIILRNQIINLILRTGQFGFLEAKVTAACLALFSLGIFAGALIPLILRAFFTLKDTKTPTLIGIGAIVFNIIFSFYFVSLLSPSGISLASSGVKFQNFIKSIFSLEGSEDISVLGLPLAFSIATIFQFIFLYFFLKKKIQETSIDNY